MKPYSPLKVTVVALVLLFAGFFSINSCKSKPGTTTTGDANVNPSFERNPPPVGDITIQELKDNKDGNVLLVADFGKTLGDVKQHAVMVGDEKFVLHDDGKDGDEKEGDGKFSIVIKEDLAELQKEFNEFNRGLTQQKELTTFDGRTMTRFPVDQLGLREFAGFRGNEVLRIPPFFRPCRPSITIKKEHSLMVTDKAVVEDPVRTFNACNNTGNPNGAWSFPHLITEMANTALTGIQPKDFLMKWLETWLTDQTVNSNVIAKRAQIQVIIDEWKTASNGTFDIKFAPFKLIAIVNRVDLRGNSGYGMSNPGEGRFVFCAVRCNGQVITVFRDRGPFMVIFEYGIPKKTCTDLRAFAKEWADLSNEVLGSPLYNKKLQNITDQFTKANADPAKPNGSSLNQMRTNEFALRADPWELREFNIDKASHLLVNVTTKQEPQTDFNQVHLPLPNVPAKVQIMANFINTHTPQVEANTYTVELIEGGQPFLAGKAHTLDPSSYHWDGDPAAGPRHVNSDKARFVFSLNTCSGCHGGEANTGNFMHVAPGGISGVPAILSGFLKGDPAMSSGPFTVTDRAGRPPAPPHEFNDLERRKLDLEKFASCPCRPGIKSFGIAGVLRERPLNMTH